MSANRKFAPKLVPALAIVCLGGMLWVVLHRSRPPAINAPPETLRRDLVQTDGRWYRRGETGPFTGLMADYYPGGARLALCPISNGLLNGVAETWYTNGQIQVREHFKGGISHGLREKWHENGSRLSRATIVEGKVTGTFQSWHDNGQLSEQIVMKQGQPDGTAWAYFPSGFLKAKTTVRAGKVLAQKTWNDGQQPPPGALAQGALDRKAN